MAYLDVAMAGARAESAPTMLDRTVRGRKAWTRSTLLSEDFLVRLGDGSLDELRRFVERLRLNPMQIELLHEAEHDLAETRAAMARAKQALARGVGFAVLDRLPVDLFSKDELKACYWILSQMIARPVAQSFKGNLLYDVIDTGLAKGPKVRADKTSAELSFHTDYGYNLPPRFIGLQVLRTGKSGGHSGVVSLYSAHNEMRRRHPDLLPRLYRPFYLNRYGEHSPDQPRASFHPVYVWDGSRLWGRFNYRNIVAGYDLAGVPMDSETKDAIDAFNEVLEDPKLWYDFALEAGQVWYLMNWHCAHRRTAYEDYEDEDRKRHLMRIFLRDEGARSYNG